MIGLEAQDLTTRILEVFHGPPGHVWEEELANLDAGRAGTALVRARREHEHRWLSVAKFLEFYRGVNTYQPDHKPDCGDCGGSGWTQADDHIENAGTDSERRYTTVKPCRCPVGKQAERSSVWRERTNDQTRENAA